MFVSEKKEDDHGYYIVIHIVVADKSWLPGRMVSTNKIGKLHFIITHTLTLLLLN